MPASPARVVSFGEIMIRLSPPGFERLFQSPVLGDRKSTRLNSSHTVSSYAVFCLKKKKQRQRLLLPFGYFAPNFRGEIFVYRAIIRKARYAGRIDSHCLLSNPDVALDMHRIYWMY